MATATHTRRSLRPTVLLPLAIGAAVAAGLVVKGRGVYVIAVAVLIPLVILIVQRPQRGVIALAALAPFTGLLIISPFPSFVSGWKEALVGTILGATFVCPAVERGAPGRRLPRWAPAVIGLLVLGFASAVQVGGYQALVGLKINYFYILLAVAIWRCPLNARDRDHLVTTLMVMGFVTSVIGLGQQVVGQQALNDAGYDYNTTIRTTGGFLRSFSTFAQPFPFGLFVMAVLLIGVPVALTDRTRLRNRLFLFASPVLVLGILFAFVRAAWLGLAIGMLYLGFKRYRLLLVGLPIGLIVFVLIGSSTLSNTTLSSSSFQERTTGWERNLTNLQTHPLGVGIGSSGAAAEVVTDPTTATNGTTAYQPDNYYFKTIYELGLLGLWMFVLFLIGAFRNTNAIANRLTGIDGALADGIAAFVLAAIAASFVATFFEVFPLDLFFWMLLGVAVTMERPPAVPATTSIRSRFVLRGR